MPYMAVVGWWWCCCCFTVASHRIVLWQVPTQEEAFAIMNLLEQCLRVSNSAVVLAAAKCFLFLVEDMPDMQLQGTAGLHYSLALACVPCARKERAASFWFVQRVSASLALAC